jgi:hypothetical protein
LPDDASRLAAELLRLADEQDAAVTAADWDGYLALADRRAAIVAALGPLIDGRQDLLPILQAVAAKDAGQQARLREATEQAQHELADMRPQQMAMHAYFGGVNVADAHEARFIDSRDER